jgi:hypothetical protein
MTEVQIEELRKKKTKEDYVLINLFEQINLPYSYREIIYCDKKTYIPKFVIFDDIVILDENDSNEKIDNIKKYYRTISLKNATINNIKDLLYKLYIILEKLDKLNISRANFVKNTLLVTYNNFFKYENIQ